MIFEEVKELEEKVEELENENQLLKDFNKALNDVIDKKDNLLKHIIPNQLYYHESRRNTTIKFLDGSSITVKRRKGEKHCIETAIAYCLLKQLMSNSQLKQLIENMEDNK